MSQENRLGRLAAPDDCDYKCSTSCQRKEHSFDHVAKSSLGPLRHNLLSSASPGTKPFSVKVAVIREEPLASIRWSGV